MRPPLGYGAAKGIHRADCRKQKSAALPETVMKSRQNEEHGVISPVQRTEFLQALLMGGRANLARSTER